MQTLEYIAPIAAPQPARIDLSRLSIALETRSTRQCAECGTDFEALGLQAYCEPCGIRVDEAASQPPPRRLDVSWPRLHAEKAPQMSGPSYDLAVRIAPRLFGNRFCVLAGDRGRGKTQIATYCALHRISRGHDSGLYVRGYDMAQRISGFDKLAALTAFQRTPFLCIDECHRIEPRHIPMLESIVDERYAHKRPTLLIGNWLDPAGVQDGQTVDGQKMHGIGPTLMDRLNEHTHQRTGGIVWCRWESYRR